MKYLINIIGVLFFLSLLTSCSKENNSCLKSTGKRTTEFRKLPLSDIHTISLEHNIDLFIKQGSEITATIDAGENLIDFIRTDVKNGVLKISNENKCNFLRSFKKEVKVYLTINQFDSLMSYGSGDIVTTDTLSIDKMKINLFETTGDLDLLLNCASECTINAHQAASNVNVRGIVRSTIFYNSGAGWYRAKDLKSVFLRVNTKSTGDCIVGNSKEMYIYLSGPGNIIYHGDPKLIQIWDNSGDGQLIKG